MQREIEKYSHKYNLWLEENRRRNACIIDDLFQNDYNIRTCMNKYNLSNENLRRIIKEFFESCMKTVVTPIALNNIEINKSIEIKYLSLSKRAINVLEKHNIKTVGNLLKFDLFSLSIGKGTLKELIDLTRTIKSI